jgi:hypothetical protein
MLQYSLSYICINASLSHFYCLMLYNEPSQIRTLYLEWIEISVYIKCNSQQGEYLRKIKRRQ